MKQNDRTISEIIALGDLTGNSDIAMRIAKRGGGLQEVMAAIAERAREKPLHDAADRLLGFDSSRDAEGYSVSRAIGACIDNRGWAQAGLERRVSDLATERSGSYPNGSFFVPFGLMARDFNAGTANQAGNTIDANRGGQLGIDPLRQVSVTGRLSATYLMGCKGALQLPRLDYPRTSSALEIAQAPDFTPTTSLIDLSPKRYSISLKVAKQALRQSSKALDLWFMDTFTKAIFEELDDEVINGSGTGSESLGIRATPNVGNVAIGTDGGFPTFALLCDVEDKPAAADLTETDLSGWALNSKTRRYLRTLARGTNLPYIWEGGERPLLGHRAVVSNILPSNLVKGTSGAVCSTLVYGSDWSQLVIATYGGGIDVMVDPITLAEFGKARITATLFGAVGLMRPQAFAKIDDLKTA